MDNQFGFHMFMFLSGNILYDIVKQMLLFQANVYILEQLKIFMSWPTLKADHSRIVLKRMVHILYNQKEGGRGVD